MSKICLGGSFETRDGPVMDLGEVLVARMQSQLRGERKECLPSSEKAGDSQTETALPGVVPK